VFFLAEERQAVEARHVSDLALCVERNAFLSRVRVVRLVGEPDRKFWDERLACGT
jgi:hypothetical protein